MLFFALTAHFISPHSVWQPIYNAAEGVKLNRFTPSTKKIANYFARRLLRSNLLCRWLLCRRFLRRSSLSCTLWFLLYWR